MFCSCFGRKRKTSEIPCDNDVAPKDVQQSSCETTIHPVTQVEETHIPLPVLENGGTPNKVLTLNGRKLPDIPHYEDLGRIWDPVADTSLTIARPHSQNAVEQRHPRTDSISKNAPNSQSSPDLHVYELEEPLASVSLPKLDNCPSSPKNVPPNGEDYGSNEAIRPHPYETLLGQTSDANYYDQQMYSTPAPRERHTPFSPTWYQSDGSARETMPPLVPAKNFTEDELYETNEASSSAATAVAGRHFSDIPYMTSPDRNSQDESVFEEFSESASSKQVISYTSISVREPIKTVLANSAAAKAVSKPRARKITEEQEAVYSTVPDDADTDQTYEVIESARSSAHLNDMYAQVSKPVTTIDETREPPEPPTLESLMNVAHAHSRQTSSSSIKNFAHGQQLTVGAGDHYADTYGSRELHPYTDPKKIRNTVHVMDTDSLEGMYAKIQKNQKKKGASSPTNRASSIIIQTQPLPQEPSEPSTSRVVFRRESSTVDPMYERINGRSEDSAARSDADTDAGIVGYESIRGSSRNNNDGGGVRSSDDPGYARVVDNGSEILDPTYECLTARRSSPGSSDPGYWKIRSPEEDLGDHLYELISSRKKEQDEEEEEEEEEEPNYDRIRSPAGNDTDEDEEEPAYEKVHQKPLPEPESDPGGDHDSDTRKVLLDDELVKDGVESESEDEDRSVNLTSKREDSSNGQM